MGFVGKQVVVDLRLVVAVLFEILLGHASTLGDHGDFLGGCSLGNFNVSQHVGPFLPAAFSYRNEAHCNDGGARKVPRHELGADSQETAQGRGERAKARAKGTIGSAKPRRSATFARQRDNATVRSPTFSPRSRNEHTPSLCKQLKSTDVKRQPRANRIVNGHAEGMTCYDSSS